MPVLSSYVCDHATLPRMSANADLPTTLKCLASGKKSIERSIPIDPRQTSAIELFLVCYLHVLLAYHCILYFGVLIIPRVHGPCPPPAPRFISLLLVSLSLPLHHLERGIGCSSAQVWEWDWYELGISCLGRCTFVYV